jgi:hypothetical protein
MFMLACVQVRRANGSQNNGTVLSRSAGSMSATNSKSGSPNSSPTATADDDPAASSGNSNKAPSILPSFQLLPSVGATGVQLLQQLSGQGGAQQQQQPQQVEGVGKQAPVDPSDLGGTAVTAQPAGLSGRSSPPVATTVKNGKK